MQYFLEQMRIKAEAKAKQMKELELSIWNKDHEDALKKQFGFSDKKVSEHKKYLMS